MGVLNRDSILAASDLPREAVTVPEWGGEVCVQTMTAGDRDAYETEVYEFDDEGKVRVKTMADFRARLLLRCIVDENGKRLFSDDDLPLLSAKNPAALDRLNAVARRLNGMGGEAEARAEKD